MDDAVGVPLIQLFQEIHIAVSDPFRFHLIICFIQPLAVSTLHKTAQQNGFRSIEDLCGTALFQDQRDCLAVSIGIQLFDLIEILIQLCHGRGHFHSGELQPVIAYKYLIRGGVGSTGDCPNSSVSVCYSVPGSPGLPEIVQLFCFRRLNVVSQRKDDAVFRIISPVSPPGIDLIAACQQKVEFFGLCACIGGRHDDFNFHSGLLQNVILHFLVNGAVTSCLCSGYGESA